ncbi:interferon-inducible GTPase 5-like [Gadus morhua]|uniref:interferon-inducible GTPase 5-like n=1 Tax=Gadus morhua TaxID=8049 RepID=UPI0011B4352C|nr:interferon-inducible GTPase 5-like [Gadus morhua]
MMENNDTDSAVSMIKKYLEDMNNPLHIAVTGESGAGKSTFVNAFRGIKDRDEGAAPTGVVETTMKPEPYPHPRHPNVTLWDLPGVGTTRYPADQYLKYVEFEKFDLFIIVSAGHFREHDAKLAQEIKKMGKNLYFVRSKIDNNLKAAQRSQREYDEEKTLQEIRENCIEGLEKQNVASPQVFLVSSFDLQLHDFPALQDTMERELPSLKRNDLICNDLPLHIAVTGEIGTGKSTFVNAFRGIDNKDEGAAPTGFVETTMKPEPYPHPIYPNVTLWDLPGIGTTKFPADQYQKYVEFKKFDFFILVSADRFTENDAKLAQEIKTMGKNLYFVRSKIDDNLKAAQRSQREYDEEKTLQEIRENCIEGLEKQGVETPQVFLVSGFDLHLYDFPALQDTMERELPSHKRNVLILTLPNVCKSIINKKKEVFRSQIWRHAITSAVVAAVPLPGLSFAADVGILVKVLRDYLFGFGLDEKSLEKLSRDTNTPLDDIKPVFTCLCSGKSVTNELVLMMLQSGALVSAALVAEEGSRWIPFIGIPTASALSFTSIYTFLSSTVNSLSVDAESIRTKFLLKKALAFSDQEQ